MPFVVCRIPRFVHLVVCCAPYALCCAILLCLGVSCVLRCACCVFCALFSSKIRPEENLIYGCFVNASRSSLRRACLSDDCMGQDFLAKILLGSNLKLMINCSGTIHTKLVQHSVDSKV